MVRLRGRSSRARGARRGVAGRAAAGRGAVGRGRVAHGSRGPGRRARGGSFSAPLMGRPRPPALQPMGYGEPDYGYAGPRMPPMMPPLIPGPRALRPYPPPAPHLAGPFLRARPFPNEYPMRHPMGMPQLPPRPMLPPVPPVPPFIRGRGGFRGGLAKTGKAFNNGALNKGKTNKKKSAKAKRNEENDPFYCEACNRSWNTEEALQEHISEHEVCGREGCTFTAHPKIVTLHVQFHHNTGIYKKIANVQSPEDIAKWIAERKSRYPTDATIAMRTAKEKEMIERGERVEENNEDRNNRQKRGEQKSNKLNWRERRLQRNQANAENKTAHKQNEVVSDEEDEDPKKNWNGNLPPFQGLLCSPTINEVDSDVIVKENTDKSDNSVGSSSFLNEDPKENPEEDVALSSTLKDCTGDTGNADVEEDAPCNEAEPTSVAKVDQAIDASICPEAATTINTVSSSGDSLPKDVDTDKIVPEQGATCNSNSPSESKLKLVPYDMDGNEESDDSGPEECPIVKTNEKSDNLPPETQSKSITATCNVSTGDNASETNDSLKNSKSRKRQRHRSNTEKGKDSGKESVKKENVVRNKKLTLLEKLLSKEIRHERNVILQCVHYVVSNNFFDDDKMAVSWMDDSDSDSSLD